MNSSVTALCRFVEQNRPLMVITGAGCSAPSGIPTYRNREAQWQRSNPIQHQEFLTREQSRKRYWARSFAGWPAVASAKPNSAHLALASLERAGTVKTLVTQNVDGLHQKAGQREVIDLHGRLDTVICLDCGTRLPRSVMQEQLARINPFLAPKVLALTPDGDAEVRVEDIERINLPHCERCHGVLKPDVVFYGGTVDKALVQRVHDRLESAGGLLVVGSSLMVFSAFRFVRRASGMGVPIAIVNQGITRGDSLAALKLDTDCEAALATLIPDRSIKP